jgi:hypothetical protein
MNARDLHERLDRIRIARVEHALRTGLAAALEPFGGDVDGDRPGPYSPDQIPQLAARGWDVRWLDHLNSSSHRRPFA